MPIYDVITVVVTIQGSNGEPRVSQYNYPWQRGVAMSPPPAEFISAVNAALAAGATLVGGVTITATPKADDYGTPLFAFSQAVLYPWSPPPPLPPTPPQQPPCLRI